MSMPSLKFSMCPGCCRGWLESSRADQTVCEHMWQYKKLIVWLQLDTENVKVNFLFLLYSVKLRNTHIRKISSGLHVHTETNQKVWWPSIVTCVTTNRESDHHCKTLNSHLSSLIYKHDHAGLTCDADALTAIVDRLRGSRWASVVKINWFILNITSSFSVNNRYRYLNVSANTNESILTQDKSLL